MSPSVVLLTGATLIVSASFTNVLRGALARRQVLDVPNHRSSHQHPVPRGGGVALIGTYLLAIMAAAFLGLAPWRTVLALGGGCTMLAIVGWLDDLRGISWRVRGAVHFISAAWAVALLHGLPQLTVGRSAIPLGWFGSLTAVLAITWAVNLFNFMDGIDGIAAGEAACIGLGAAALLGSLGANGHAVLALLFAASSAGFLVWNWPPARIFMGDVGSGPLGYAVSVLGLATERAHELPLIVWGILSGVFILDATVTLIRRLHRGARVHEAHRDHAYQRAVLSGWPHWKVTAGVIVLNAFLFGISWFQVSRPSAAIPTLGVAVVVLTTIFGLVERRRGMVRPEAQSE